MHLIDLLAPSRVVAGASVSSKKKLLDLFHATFDAARARRAELERDPGAVEAILQKGADRARAVAMVQMDAVKRAAGLL